MLAKACEVAFNIVTRIRVAQIPSNTRKFDRLLRYGIPGTEADVSLGVCTGEVEQTGIIWIVDVIGAGKAETGKGQDRLNFGRPIR